MDKLLKPDRFDTDPNAPNASQEWTHWLVTFENFLTSIGGITNADKLRLLTNYVSYSIYKYIIDCKNYKDALDQLQKIYVKPKNEIFARYLLTTRKQQSEETVDQYHQALIQLSRECNFKAVNADQNRDDYVRDAFINGLYSSLIRQRLLENTTIQLSQALSQALSIESAQKHSEAYMQTNNSVGASLHEVQEELDSSLTLNAAVTLAKCYFCGNKRHPRATCPAKESLCNECGKLGHFSKVCLSKRSKRKMSSASTNPTDNMTAAAPECLSKSLIKIKVNNVIADALIDTGSSQTFVDKYFVLKSNIKLYPSGGNISMATTSLHSQICGYCTVNIELLDNFYYNMKLFVLENLCADIIIGHDILKQHSTVEMNFGGPKSPLTICSLAPATIESPYLFSNLAQNCKPIATKSRKHTYDDLNFIKEEVKKLLSDGIIEESRSPWRSQVLVTRNENHKRRMVVDYSQTINRFTYLDAYPLPSTERIVAEVSKFNIFSTIDLRSAYHQIPIKENEKQYTAFEADGSLYQFCRIPFGVTNGVACFQRVLDSIVKHENLEGIYVYLDDITICGKTQSQHEKNLDKFLDIVKKYNLTINEEKSSFNKKSITLLGYLIENNTLRPDPSRLDPLINLPVPNDSAALKRVIGMFSHYAKWIPYFSEKIYRLVQSKGFPLTSEAKSDFQTIKTEIASSVVTSIQDDLPFVVETDASDHSIAAHLSQAGKPIAFFSRTLSKSEQKHSSIEKEAYAIVESLRKWRHFLIGKHFKLYTDQKSVSFMFNMKHASKIKNEKILRWRLELACYSFDIIYHPGKNNVVADTFSRVCGAISQDTLFNLHKSLCHPGITRMMHWIRSKNMPYSVEDVRKTITSCRICAELKPRFTRCQRGTLIKATSPFERLNVDFKGPLPTRTNNKYLLTIIDEYSRFPFAYACSDMTSQTVIKCLNNLFSIFGLPSYIHSDQGSAFMSRELKSFLSGKGIATSRTTPYNPQGNGLVERYNGILWKTITLALKTNDLHITQWELMLDQSLHSVRSLLCTSTNCTPHERMFIHPRKSTNGNTVPSWLTSPGPALLKKFNKKNKYEPLVEEVYLIEANPEYALIRTSEGREMTVSLKYLAPI